MDDGQLFLSVPQVARIIGASEARTYDMVAAGMLPAIRLGRRVRIPRAAFDAWAARMSEQALASVRALDSERLTPGVEEAAIAG